MKLLGKIPFALSVFMLLAFSLLIVKCDKTEEDTKIDVYLASDLEAYAAREAADNCMAQTSNENCDSLSLHYS